MVVDQHKVDVIYMARNRLEFTRISLSWLLHTLDVDYVGSLILVDDGSEDGTDEYLLHMKEFVFSQLVPTQFLSVQNKSMSLSLRDALKLSTTDIFCKLDNDYCILEKGWLKRMVVVLRRTPTLCCLGATNPRIRSMEKTIRKDEAGLLIKQGYLDTSRIGGIGLFRRDMFNHILDTPKYAQLEGTSGYSGIALAQTMDKRRKGWIVPSFKAELLDFSSTSCWYNHPILNQLTERYVAKRYGRANNENSPNRIG